MTPPLQIKLKEIRLKYPWATGSYPSSESKYARLWLGLLATHVKEESMRPCWRYTGPFTDEFWSPFLWGILCISKMYPSFVVTCFISHGYPLYSMISHWMEARSHFLAFLDILCFVFTFFFSHSPILSSGVLAGQNIGFWLKRMNQISERRISSKIIRRSFEDHS